MTWRISCVGKKPSLAHPATRQPVSTRTIAAKRPKSSWQVGRKRSLLPWGEATSPPNRNGSRSWSGQTCAYFSSETWNGTRFILRRLTSVACSSHQMSPWVFTGFGLRTRFGTPRQCCVNRAFNLTGQLQNCIHFTPKNRLWSRDLADDSSDLALFLAGHHCVGYLPESVDICDPPSFPVDT